MSDDKWFVTGKYLPVGINIFIQVGIGKTVGSKIDTENKTTTNDYIRLSLSS